MEKTQITKDFEERQNKLNNTGIPGKLKTLKDIKYTNPQAKISKEAIADIKAEAVKWVKYFEKGREDCLGIKQYEEADKVECLMGFILNFFNLTEEDLK